MERIAEQELAVLSRISPSTAEYTIGVTYIDYLISLPWNTKTEDNLDIARAERILNENHFGLNKIKERVMEHLAVKVLMMNRKPRRARRRRRGDRAQEPGPRAGQGRVRGGDGGRRRGGAPGTGAVRSSMWC